MTQMSYIAYASLTNGNRKTIYIHFYISHSEALVALSLKTDEVKFLFLLGYTLSALEE